MAIQVDVDFSAALKAAQELGDKTDALAQKGDRLSDSFEKGFADLGKEFRSVASGLGGLEGTLKSMLGEMKSNQKLMQESSVSAKDWAKAQKLLEVSLDGVVGAIKKQTEELKKGDRAQKDLVESTKKAGQETAKAAKYIEIQMTAKQKLQRLDEELNALAKAGALTSGQRARAQEIVAQSFKNSGTQAEVLIRKLKEEASAFQAGNSVLDRRVSGYDLLNKKQKEVLTVLQQFKRDAAFTKDLFKVDLTPLQQLQQQMEALDRMRRVYKDNIRGEDGQRAGLSATQYTEAVRALREKINAEEAHIAKLKEKKPVVDADAESLRKKMGLMQQELAIYPKTAEAISKAMKGYQGLNAVEKENLKTLNQRKMDLQTINRYYKDAVPPVERYRQALEAANRAQASGALSRGGFAAVKGSATKELLASAAATSRLNQGITRLVPNIGLLNQATATGRAAMMGLGQSFGIFTGRTILAAGATYAFAKAIKSSISAGMQFEYSLTRVAVMSSDLGDILSKSFDKGSSRVRMLRDEMLRLSETTQFNSVEIAAGAEILARSGRGSAFIYANLASVLDLAAVGMVDMATAADIATGVMSAFKLEGAQFSEAVDILAAASIKTKANVEQMGLSLQYIGPIANQAGIQFHTVAAALGTLADDTIRGSKAGTAMRRIITNLLSPTAAASKAFKEMKIDLDDFTQGGVLDLEGVFQALNRQGASVKQLRDIFGMYAISASSALVGSADKLTELGESFQQVTGYAANMRDELRKNLKLELEELSSVWQTIQVVAFDTFGGSLSSHVKTLTDYLRNNKEEIASWIAGAVDGIAKIVQGLIEWRHWLGTIAKATISIVASSMLIRGVVSILTMLKMAWAALVVPMQAAKATNQAMVASQAAFSVTVNATTGAIISQTTALGASTVAATKFGSALRWVTSASGIGLLITAATSLAAYFWMSSDSIAESIVPISSAAQTMDALGDSISTLDNTRLDRMAQELPKDLAKIEDYLKNTSIEVERLTDLLRKFGQARAMERNLGLSAGSLAGIEEETELKAKLKDLTDKENFALEEKKTILESIDRLNVTASNRAIEASEELVRSYGRQVRLLAISKEQVSDEFVAGIIGQLAELGTMSVPDFFAAVTKSGGDFRLMLDGMVEDLAAKNLAANITEAFKVDIDEDNISSLQNYHNTLVRLIKTMSAGGPIVQMAARIMGKSVEELNDQLNLLRVGAEQLLPEPTVIKPKGPDLVQKAADELKKYFDAYEKGIGSTKGLARELGEVDGWIKQIQENSPAAVRALTQAGYDVEEALKALEFSRESNILDFAQTILQRADPAFSKLSESINRVTSENLSAEDAVLKVKTAFEALGLSVDDELFNRIADGIRAVKDGSADLRVQWEELTKQAAKIKADFAGQQSFDVQVSQFADATGLDASKVEEILAMNQAHAIFGDTLRAVRPEAEQLAEAQRVLAITAKTLGISTETAEKAYHKLEVSLPIGAMREETKILRDRIGYLGRSTREQFVFNKAVEDSGSKWRKASAEFKAAAGEMYDATEQFDKVKEMMEQFGDDAFKSPILEMVDGIDALNKTIEELKDSLSGIDDETERAFKIKQIEEYERALGRAKQTLGHDMRDAAYQTMDAMKAFTKEGSKGFRAMEAGMAALSIIQDVVALKAAVTAVLSQGQGDPYSAWARMAAMAAAVAPFLASIGVTLSGFGGGGSSNKAANRQASQGTGTVLGDSEAKSASIVNATKITSDATSALVGINRGMLRALVQMQNSIGSATGMLARGAGNVEFGNFDPGFMLNARNGAAMGAVIGSVIPILGTAVGAVLGAVLGGLLRGSSRLTDQGINIGGGSLEDMGFQAYQEHEVRRWRWGTRRSSTQTGDLPDEVANQFGLIMDSIVNTVTEAALALGLLPEEINAALNTYRLEEIKISLKDLTADEQQAALEAVFSSIFDGIAGHVVPFIGQFQRAGEGLGETLVRVATSVQVVQESMRYLGLAIDEADPEKFAQLSVALIDMTGGIEDFISKMISFADNFAPGAFRFAANQSALNDAFEQYNMVVPSTRDEMWALMQSLDATTESGREQIAMLLNMGDAAHAYYQVLEQIESDMNSLRMQALGENETLADQINRQIRQIRDLGASEADLAEARDLGMQILRRALDDFMEGIEDSLAEFEGNKYIRQFQAITSQMDENIRVARQLGASERDLSRIRKLAAHQAAQLINELRLSITDLWGRLTARPDAGGFDPVSASNDLFEAERRRYEMAQKAIQNIGDYLLRLTYNDLAPTDWRTRLGENRSTFDQMLQRAMGGDEDAINEITRYADDLLQMGRDILGPSVAYNELYDYVTAALRGLQSNLGAIEDPGQGAGSGYGEGTPGAPFVTVSTEDDRFQLALQIASQIGALGFATGVDVFHLLDEFGIPLLDLVSAMNIDINRLTEEGLINLSLLAGALNVNLTDLIDRLEIDYEKIAEVFGVSVDGMREGVLDGFLEFAEWLGVPILEALGLINLSIGEVATGFGYEMGEQNTANWNTMKELARLLGLDILALTEALGEDIGLVVSSITGDLMGVFADLPEDLPEGIRDQLEGLFTALGAASSPAEVRAVMDSLFQFTRDNLPASLATSLGAVFQSLGLVPPVEPLIDPVAQALQRTTESVETNTKSMMNMLNGNESSVFTMMNTHLRDIASGITGHQNSQYMAMMTETPIDEYVNAAYATNQHTPEEIEEVKNAIVSQQESLEIMADALVDISNKQLEAQKTSNETLERISTNTKMNTLKERKGKKV